MGCMDSRTEKYFDYSKNDEEKNFRNWEKTFGFQRNCFSNVFSEIDVDNNSIKSSPLLETILKRNFSDKFLEIAKLPHFYNQQTNSFNAKNLKYLLFLATVHIEQFNNNVSYFDKAIYVFQFVNCLEHQSSNSPIEKSSEKVTELITDLFEISAIVLPTLYLKTNAIKGDLYDKYKTNKNAIAKNIVNNLFKDNDGKELNFMSFKDLNNLFLKNKKVSYFNISFFHQDISEIRH